MWSQASDSSADRCMRRVAAAAERLFQAAASSGRCSSASDGATTSDEPGRMRKISVARWRAFCIAMLPAAMCRRPGMQ